MKTKSNVFNTPPATVFMLKTGVCVHFKDETVLRDIYIYIYTVTTSFKLRVSVIL